MIDNFFLTSAISVFSAILVQTKQLYSGKKKKKVKVSYASRVFYILQNVLEGCLRTVVMIDT